MNPTKFSRVPSPIHSLLHSPLPIHISDATVAHQKVHAPEPRLHVKRRHNISPQISRNPREVLRPKPFTPMQFSSSNEKKHEQMAIDCKIYKTGCKPLAENRSVENVPVTPCSASRVPFKVESTDEKGCSADDNV